MRRLQFVACCNRIMVRTRLWCFETMIAVVKEEGTSPFLIQETVFFV
jgi:hypothetical protein